MNKLLLLCFLVFTPVTFAMADMKVAVIDLSKVFDSYYKTKDAQARIKTKQDGFQKEYQDLITDYQHMGEEAQKLQDAAKDPTLSQPARDDKTKALQAKAQDLQNMQRKIEEMKNERTRELQDEMVRRHKEIVDELSKNISDYASSQGFDLVIDKSSQSATSGVSMVLYSSSKLTDITGDIITKVNAGAPAGGTAASAPAPAGGATPAAH